MLSDNIYDYNNVAQGKITIPNVDDGEECVLTDVSVLLRDRFQISLLKSSETLIRYTVMI